MKDYRLEFSLLNSCKVILGIDYTEGTLHEEDGDKDFKEVVLGFFFFYISFMIIKKKEGL